LNGDLLSESSGDGLNQGTIEQEVYQDIDEGEDSSLPDPEELEKRRPEIKDLSDLDNSEDPKE